MKRSLPIVLLAIFVLPSQGKAPAAFERTSATALPGTQPNPWKLTSNGSAYRTDFDPPGSVCTTPEVVTFSLTNADFQTFSNNPADSKQILKSWKILDADPNNVTIVIVEHGKDRLDHGRRIASTKPWILVATHMPSSSAAIAAFQSP